MRRLFVASLFLLILVAQTNGIPTTPKDFFCIFCQRFGTTLGGPVTETFETAMDISQRLYTACISLSEAPAERCRWFFKRARDRFGWFSKRLSEFPQACYGIYFACPHSVNEEQVKYYREAFIENSGQLDPCNRCKRVLNGIYAALRTEDKKPILEQESKLYCEKQQQYSKEYCESETLRIVEETLKPITNDACQKFGLCGPILKGPPVSSPKLPPAT
eukprot:g64.t1